MRYISCAVSFGLGLALVASCGESGKVKTLTIRAKQVKSKDPREICLEVKTDARAQLKLEGVDERHVTKKGNLFCISEYDLKPGKTAITIRADIFKGGMLTANGKLRTELVRIPHVKVIVQPFRRPGPGDLMIGYNLSGLRASRPGKLPVSRATGLASMTLKAPPGTAIEFQGKKWKSTPGKQTLTVTFDALKRYFYRKYKMKRWRQETPNRLKITSPRGRVHFCSITTNEWNVLSQLFKKASTKPVVAPGENLDGPHKALIVYKPYKKTWLVRRVLGKATCLADKTLVAYLFKVKKPRTKTCGPYRNRRTGKSVTLTNKAFDTIVKVYDRRTAKIYREKRFRAKMPKCDKSFKASRGGGKLGGSASGVPVHDIDKWLETLVAK